MDNALLLNNIEIVRTNYENTLSDVVNNFKHHCCDCVMMQIYKATSAFDSQTHSSALTSGLHYFEFQLFIYKQLNHRKVCRVQPEHGIALLSFSIAIQKN